MDRDLAIEIKKELDSRNGPTLSTLEAMSMEELQTDGYLIFAIQKDDVTFLAWCKESKNQLILLKVNTVFW